jgi:NADP-dependent 3-hydroxy acid dehydrogenase YdfG
MAALAATGVVWVTGASSGIGAAIAERLVREGFPVAATARRRRLLSQLARRCPGIAPFPCDCTDAAAVSATVSALRQRYGPPYALIHCAGSALFKPLVETTVAEFEALMSANVRTLFLCLQAVLPDMLQHRRGLIVAISSVAAFKPFALSAVYGGFKAAAAQMLRGLREEVRSHGIKVVNVYVGATATPLWSATLRRRWHHRMLQPDDVAEAVAALVRMASYPRLMPEELVLRPQEGDLP